MQALVWAHSPILFKQDSNFVSVNSIVVRAFPMFPVAARRWLVGLTVPTAHLRLKDLSC